MSSKTLIWLGFFIGSLIGSLIPLLWGANPLSLSSVFLSALGAIGGIWLAYKMSH